MILFRNRFLIATQTSALLIAATALFAETDDNSKALKDIQAEPASPISHTVAANYSYVGGADLKSGIDGTLNEQSSEFRYDLRVPLNDTVGLGFGLGYKRIDFGVPDGSFLPDNLQTVNISILGRYRLSNEWGLFAMFGPRLNLINDWNDIDSKNVRWSGAVGAQYEFNKDLSLQFGVAISPDFEDVPVMPVLGARWHFAEKWTLNAGFPRTALDYQLLNNLRLSLEAAFLGGVFETSSTYGNESGNPDLNDRTLRYDEVRVGLGALYNLTKNVDLELNAGAAVYRKFEFEDVNYDVKAEPAPYISAGVKVKF